LHIINCTPFHVLILGLISIVKFPVELGQFFCVRNAEGKPVSLRDELMSLKLTGIKTCEINGLKYLPQLTYAWACRKVTTVQYFISSCYFTYST